MFKTLVAVHADDIERLAARARLGGELGMRWLRRGRSQSPLMPLLPPRLVIVSSAVERGRR
uniref:Uncharacterized protein n=1 Tax=Arundo donax TaxID=35708 RepID=A0A0A8Y3K1_ARUDO